jgi:hypothetical protein
LTGIQAGAIFINQSASAYFSTLFSTGLKGSDLEEYTQEAVESFEWEAKKAFDGPAGKDMTIEVGGRNFTDKSIGVHRGTMNLTGFVLRDRIS